MALAAIAGLGTDGTGAVVLGERLLRAYSVEKLRFLTKSEDICPYSATE